MEGVKVPMLDTPLPGSPAVYPEGKKDPEKSCHEGKTRRERVFIMMRKWTICLPRLSDRNDNRKGSLKRRILSTSTDRRKWIPTAIIKTYAVATMIRTWSGRAY